MEDKIKIQAKITGIKYKPHLCKKLDTYDYKDLELALNKSSTFFLEISNKNKYAISWWVSAKRTRSYPFARVYNTLDYEGRKVTIIPIFKDEGADGDRDFIQWDTISLMSLLGVYVIISYYSKAVKNSKYENKITKQKFDINHIKKQLSLLSTYKSDPLHWNLEQASNVVELGKKAIEYYQKISDDLGIKMTSSETAKQRFLKIAKNSENFINGSRVLAEKAQLRESITIQPKENLSGKKGVITISNYLGGMYYWTCDEVEIIGSELNLIEGKHSKSNIIPSENDIKDGLLKMILYCNLEDIKADNRSVKTKPKLKLTSSKNFQLKSLTDSQKTFLKNLLLESKTNHIQIQINEKDLDYLI